LQILGDKLGHINSNSLSRNSKLVYSLIGLAILLVFFSAIPHGMAESLASSPTAPIVVQTDKVMYERGDIMVISGQIRNIVSVTPLTIQIVDPNQNIVHVDQILVAKDGRFSLIVPVEGPLWKVPGNYTLISQYGPKHISSMVQFQFEEFEIPITGAFNVKDKPSGQNFDLNYTITGGMVKSMYLQPQDLALIVELDAKTQGMIHLQIPRLLLDAKKDGNIDESFIILVNDDEISSASEGSHDSYYRYIDIPIVNGDSKIEIIGTQAIPEFANITEFVFVTAVGSILILSFVLKRKLNYFSMIEILKIYHLQLDLKRYIWSKTDE
jgi:hypothetical protein